MAMDKFDDIFRENVKKAFGNYNADHLADEGWSAFTRKKPLRRGFASVIPVWAKAATVAVIISLGILIAYMVSTHNISRDAITGVASAEKKDKEPALNIETGKEVSRFPSPVRKTLEREAKSAKKTVKKKNIFSKEDLAPEQIPQNDANIKVPEKAELSLSYPGNIPVLPFSGIIKDLSKYTKPGDVISEDLIYENLKPVEKIMDQDKTASKSALLAGLSGSIAQRSGKTYPASGLSVGFYLDRKLTKKISLRPGLAVGKQSLGLENENSIAVYGNPVSFSDGTTLTPCSIEGRLNILAMELPLNLVFRIIDRGRSGFYVSAGASTMIYISQQYSASQVIKYTKVTYNSISGAYIPETSYTTVEVAKDYGALSKSDLLGLANLSAGYSFPYGKTGTMLIEPFIQLPVNGLTSLDLKIRYGGISMKLRLGKKDQDNSR
jgi:hypothetical protein